MNSQKHFLGEVLGLWSWGGCCHFSVTPGCLLQRTCPWQHRWPPPRGMSPWGHTSPGSHQPGWRAWTGGLRPACVGGCTLLCLIHKPCSHFLHLTPYTPTSQHPKWYVTCYKHGSALWLSSCGWVTLSMTNKIGESDFHELTQEGVCGWVDVWLLVGEPQRTLGQ